MYIVHISSTACTLARHKTAASAVLMYKPSHPFASHAYACGLRVLVERASAHPKDMHGLGDEMRCDWLVFVLFQCVCVCEGNSAH